MYKDISKEMLNFIKKSPSVFHAVGEIKNVLISNGFTELNEGKKWSIEKSKKYFVTRNLSSVIAFKTGEDLEDYSFNIVASHGDSPNFKIKDNYLIESKNKYVQLNTEKYGGMIYSSWFDRPLSAAGRITVKKGSGIESRLVNIDRDLVIIPNVAIHMNREVNSAMKYNEQVDLLPFYGSSCAKEHGLMDLVAEFSGEQKDSIISADLYLYNRMEPSIWGGSCEFLSSPRLDNLQCAFATLKGFIQGHNSKSVSVYCCFDNEEVGSGTKQGAASTFLPDVLKRINASLGKTDEDYLCALASSFMVSADNAHAVHPNHPEKSDPSNSVYMNEGVVIKHNANQKYTTDSVSCAVFQMLCENSGVKYQHYSNRSDMTGGSTLGNIASLNVSINTVDVGLAQLAMHSSYETAGVMDTYSMAHVIEEFFNSHVEQTEIGKLKIVK